MTDDDPFRLSPSPRRRKPDLQPARPGPVSFLIEMPGQPPRRINLTQRQAAVVAQLAGPEGMSGGTQTAARIINELRAAGLLVVTIRQPRADGGSGWTARYCLAAGQTITPQAE